jgi:hypothetical protein
MNNIKDFFIGQKLVAKETVWSKSNDSNHVPYIVLIKHKEYEVVQTNQVSFNSIAVIIEDGSIGNYTINDDDSDDYKFPFYNKQELRNLKLNELGI